MGTEATCTNVWLELECFDIHVGPAQQFGISRYHVDRELCVV